MIQGLMGMKIATGRALVCIGQAGVPLSIKTLTAAVAKKYDKLHDGDTISNSIAFLRSHQLINAELTLTPNGKAAYELMLEHGSTNDWAHKFFRKSNSPNIGNPAATVLPTNRQHVPVSGLMVVR